MAKYADLTRLLPTIVDLGGVVELARELGISLDHEPPAEPDDQDGREWERFSLYHLLDGLLRHRVLDEFTDGGGGRVLVAENHWQDFVRTGAEDLGEIDHIATYVDWRRYAEDVRIDYVRVDVEAGEFRGTWYVRR